MDQSLLHPAHRPTSSSSRRCCTSQTERWVKHLTGLYSLNLGAAQAGIYFSCFFFKTCLNLWLFEQFLQRGRKQIHKMFHLNKNLIICFSVLKCYSWAHLWLDEVQLEKSVFYLLLKARILLFCCTAQRFGVVFSSGWRFWSSGSRGVTARVAKTVPECWCSFQSLILMFGFRSNYSFNTSLISLSHSMHLMQLRWLPNNESIQETFRTEVWWLD